MAKDKKSKTAGKKARVAAKQSKKATQKETKSKSKSKAKEIDDSDAEDVDLESVLAEYAKKVKCHRYARLLSLNNIWP